MSKEAFARYSPRPYPGRPVLFLSREETATYSSDPASDWRRLGTGGVDVRELPGYHDAIVAEPQVRELAGQLRGLLLETIPTRDGLLR
jgi:thioesterase domain-containing protein